MDYGSSGNDKKMKRTARLVEAEVVHNLQVKNQQHPGHPVNAILSLTLR
jgi:hypothetical protein